MKSEFQFTTPALLNIEFHINDNFNEEVSVTFEVKTSTEVKRSSDSNEAMVFLGVEIGEKSEKYPFYVRAKEYAKFKWKADVYTEDQVVRLLKQNAPALLLSYLRPVISSVTGASVFHAYDIPFMNFASNTER